METNVTKKNEEGNVVGGLSVIAMIVTISAWVGTALSKLPFILMAIFLLAVFIVSRRLYKVIAGSFSDNVEVMGTVRLGLTQTGKIIVATVIILLASLYSVILAIFLQNFLSLFLFFQVHNLNFGNPKLRKSEARSMKFETIQKFKCCEFINSKRFGIWNFEH